MGQPSLPPSSPSSSPISLTLEEEKSYLNSPKKRLWGGSFLFFFSFPFSPPLYARRKWKTSRPEKRLPPLHPFDSYVSLPHPQKGDRIYTYMARGGKKTGKTVPSLPLPFLPPPKVCKEAAPERTNKRPSGGNERRRRPCLLKRKKKSFFPFPKKCL